MFRHALNSIEPPWYGPVCPVVWEGRCREASPYPDQSPNWVRTLEYRHPELVGHLPAPGLLVVTPEDREGAVDVVMMRRDFRHQDHNFGRRGGAQRHLEAALLSERALLLVRENHRDRFSA